MKPWLLIISVLLSSAAMADSQVAADKVKTSPGVALSNGSPTLTLVDSCWNPPAFVIQNKGVIAKSIKVGGRFQVQYQKFGQPLEILTDVTGDNPNSPTIFTNKDGTFKADFGSGTLTDSRTGRSIDESGMTCFTPIPTVDQVF